MVAVGTASRWALIRSRLPYRSRRLMLSGVMLLGAVAATLVARSHTPEGMVLSNYPYEIPVAFTVKDGQIPFDKLQSDKQYGLVRQENGEAVLRQWVPGIGYAEAHVPAGYVRLQQ